MKQWNVNYVQSNFPRKDAKEILAIQIPQRQVRDRGVWSSSIDGVYNAKAGYQFGYEQKFGNCTIPQNRGWSKIWHLTIPHKMKIFLCGIFVVTVYLFARD